VSRDADVAAVLVELGPQATVALADAVLDEFAGDLRAALTCTEGEWAAAIDRAVERLTLH
jgi:hypothetical protein